MIHMAGVNNSAAFVGSVLSDIKKTGDGHYQLANKLDFSGSSITKWKKIASYAVGLLNAKGISYSLIKAYDIPFAFMEDVDILVEDSQRLITIYSALVGADFRFKHVPFNDKLKLSALRDSDIEIDFYPDSKWGQLRYARSGSILARRRLGKKHGIEAFVPRAEDEIYMIASHAYNHGRINLLEAVAAAKIILDESPDMEEISSMSQRFHLESATLVLVHAADWLLKSYNFPRTELPDQLYNSAHNSFRKIVDKGFSLDAFPLKFSKISLISCALSKISAKGLDEHVPRLDELANFALHNELANILYERVMPEYIDIRRHLDEIRRT